MTVALKELERLDARVIAALRCIDAATGAQVGQALRVGADGVKVLRNRSGLYVLTTVSGLSNAESSFQTQPAPDQAEPLPNLALQVVDPTDHYLPRQVLLPLPRQADPSRSTATNWLFRPHDVAMYPSPVAEMQHNWSVLRLTVSDRISKDLLGGALVLARRGSTVLARTLSDGRGEALLVVPGVPVTTWSSEPGAVVVDHITAQLQLVFNPTVGTRLPTADLLAASRRIPRPFVNPDELERQRSSLPRSVTTVQLAAGQTQSLSLSLNLP